MGKNSFSDILSLGRILVGAMRAHSDEFAKHSIGEADFAAADAEADGIEESNAKQERLKADLKTCTAETNARLLRYKKRIADYKKLVKFAIPPTQWKEFGIDDKQ